MRLGVDIGGTKIEAAMINEKGKIIDKIRQPTESFKGKEQVLKNILSAIKALDYKEAKHIGLSFAGVINHEGIITRSPNITCMEKTNLAKEISKKTKKKCYQENDANCFALAEKLFGAGKGHKHVIGLIIGTGIGAGIIINHSIYKGAQNNAGEFGHTIIDGVHDFESLASGPAIQKRYMKEGGKINDARVEDILASKERVAEKVMETTFQFMGIGVANIINSYDPEVIVLGGGISNVPLYQKLKEEVKKYVMPNLSENVKILKNQLGDSSGVIGAAFLKETESI